MHNSADSDEVVELHRTVQSLFEEEEALLNLHMNVIQVSQYGNALGALCVQYIYPSCALYVQRV
jgi:hypothetical protein